MSLRRTDHESHITEYTLVYEDKALGARTPLMMAIKGRCISVFSTKGGNHAMLACYTDCMRPISDLKYFK